MRRLIVGLLLLVTTSITMQAARAFSEPVTVAQPDGTMLTVTLHGDEYAHWLAASDGTLLVETDGRYYVAAVGDNGELTATPLLAHNIGQRSADEQQACQAQQLRRSMFFRHLDRLQQESRRAQVTSSSYFPHAGSPKCLVILANFSDNQFTSAQVVEQFNQYFNGETQQNMGYNEDKNLVSVRKYFEHSSHGAFTPQFDIVGPVTLPQALSYYGQDQGTTKDIRYNTFCKDAIAAVDGLVDFHDYDNDGNGTAELVCVIYAGCGQSVTGNPANTIWPKCGHQGISTQDGVTVSYMNCSPELYRTDNTDINGIGLFIHEFSHGMGLPDHYVKPENESAHLNNQSPEFWDLMDYGEYEGNGYTPVPYTAWEQAAMGWIEIEELTESQNGVELKSLMREGGKAYKFGNGGSAEEWMILENVQARNTTDHVPGFRYGHGLLVWHIAYNYSTVNMGDYPNNVANVPRVCIVPADGLVINGYLFGLGKPYTQAEYIASLGGDPFPGTGNVQALNATMGLPNYTYYSGDATPTAELRNITENTTTGTVTFDFYTGTTTVFPVVRTVTPAPADAAYYSLDGRRISGQPVSSGLYIHNGRKVVLH